MSFINNIKTALVGLSLTLCPFIAAMEMRVNSNIKPVQSIESNAFPKIKISNNYTGTENARSYSKLPLDPAIEAHLKQVQYEAVLKKQLDQAKLEIQRINFNKEQQSGCAIQTIPDPDKPHVTYPFIEPQQNGPYREIISDPGQPLVTREVIEKKQAVTNKPITVDAVPENKTTSHGAQSSLPQSMDIQQASIIIQPNGDIDPQSITQSSPKFALNNNAEIIIKEYGKDPKSITNFTPQSFDQLVIHDFIVDSINQHASKLTSSRSLDDQIIRIHTIGNLLKANDLNARNKLPYLDQVLIKAWHDFSPTIIKFTVNVIKKLSQNISHPIDYIKQRVTELHDVAMVLTNKAIQYLIPVKQTLTANPSEMGKYAQECAQRLGANPKEFSDTVSDVITDMTFSGGLGLVKKGVRIILSKDISTITNRLLSATKKINDVAQPEKQVITTTPEGVKVVLNSEIDQAAKQGAQQAAKSMGKMEQQTIKKNVQQVEKVVETGTPDLVQQTAKTAKKIEEALVNQSAVPLFKDGFVEVNGFKFTEHYFNYLYENGRPVPGLCAKEILESAIITIPDPQGAAGFFKYFTETWEMVYNPVTKRIVHIGYINK